MSIRGNYFLVEAKPNGQPILRIIFVKYPQEEIIGWLLGGLETVRARLGVYDPISAPMDEIFADCGFLLDETRRQVKFFLYEQYGVASVRQFLLETARSRWPGWEVSYAHEGILELAEAAGLERNLVQIEPNMHYQNRPDGLSHLLNDAQYTAEEINECDPDTGEVLYVNTRFYGTYLTVRHANGQIGDYGVGGYELNSILSAGPALLPALQARGSDIMPPPLEGYHPFGYIITGRGDQVASGAFVDEPNHTIRAWWQKATDNRHLLSLQPFWPGWTLNRITGNLPEQMELAGRDPSLTRLSQEHVITILKKEGIKDLPE